MYENKNVEEIKEIFAFAGKMLLLNDDEFESVLVLSLVERSPILMEKGAFTNELMGKEMARVTREYIEAE